VLVAPVAVLVALVAVLVALVGMLVGMLVVVVSERHIVHVSLIFINTETGGNVILPLADCFQAPANFCSQDDRRAGMAPETDDGRRWCPSAAYSSHASRAESRRNPCGGTRNQPLSERVMRDAEEGQSEEEGMTG
jgi:hypothetical protein